MGACGERVFFSPMNSEFIYENMYIGNDVHIAYHADMVASKSRIIIGDHVVFGPHVSIRGGDHRTDVVGMFVDQVGNDMKLPENDQDVVFEGDNWIGMNSTILKGVTVSRGCIIAAGSVVNKMPPPILNNRWCPCKGSEDAIYARANKRTRIETLRKNHN